MKHPVDHVVEQLWAPALRSPDLRVVVDTPEDHVWQDVERYWLVPNRTTARLLVPCGPRLVTSRLLTNYRALRPSKVRIVRQALGTAARTGAPLSRHTVAVQVRRSNPVAAERLPLMLLSQAMGRRLYAATGVRTSENRKTTLHLVGQDGEPIGYAKFGWNSVTNALVANEARTLLDIGGGHEGAAHAPTVLAQADYAGNSVVVTSPLPLDVRGGEGDSEDLSPRELFGLTPVARVASPARTGQFTALRTRLDETIANAVAREVAGPAKRLADRVARATAPLPVTTRWHGDLAPWNCARTRTRTLWIWDWENSEVDAVAGLDALHWTFSLQRLTAADVDRMDLPRVIDQARGYLAAMGLSQEHRSTVAALYVVTIAERAATLAAQSGTWADAFISPRGLRHLLAAADAQLELP